MSEELTALWRAYKREPSEERFEAIVTEMKPYMFSLAANVLGRYPRMIDIDDIYAGALLGLLHAVRRFKPRGGASFKTYATTRIVGAIHDEIRMMDHLPRSLRRMGGLLRRQHAILCAVLDREPTIAEIARHLGKTVKACREVMTAYNHFNKMSSVELLVSGHVGGSGVRMDSERVLDIVCNEPEKDKGYDGFDEIRHTELVEKLKSCLGKRHQRVFCMHFVDGMTLRQIGAILRVSESRVCQMTEQIKRKLALHKHEILKSV